MENPEISIITLGQYPSKELDITIEKTFLFAYEFSIEWVFILFKQEEIKDFKLYFNKLNKINIAYKVSFCSKGIASSINQGIKLSSNKWIIVLHSGDYILYDKKKFSLIREKLKNANNPSINIFGTIYKSKANKMSFSKHHNNKIRNFRSPWVPHQSTFVHREIYKKQVYDENFKSALDYEFFLRCSKLRIPIFTHKEYITVFSLGGESSNINKSIIEVYRALEKNREINPIAIIFDLILVLKIYIKKIIFVFIKNIF